METLFQKMLKYLTKPTHLELSTLGSCPKSQEINRDLSTRQQDLHTRDNQYTHVQNKQHTYIYVYVRTTARVYVFTTLRVHVFVEAP